MKIAYSHLLRSLDSNPSISQVSDMLFQLGHEHEINGDILDIDFTPNRGDCLSLDGILRDLNIFFKESFYREIYKNDFDVFKLNFKNKTENACKNISFLKVDVDNISKEYKGELKSYYKDLNLNTNNFFTDISNYISYETGQPTHCYDALKVGKAISLEHLDTKENFKTLLDSEIKINPGDLVFCDENGIINLAGIVGSKDSACSKNTNSVIIECASFNPECIIGKSVKYDINSDAAYKFERGVDQKCHEYVLRRFLKIIENHANIKKIELFHETYIEFLQKKIDFNCNKINKILGTGLSEEKINNYLVNLGFEINSSIIKVPSYRNDIHNLNDIAEEIARSIGFDNINRQTLELNNDKKLVNKNFEKNIKNLLINNGFSEVINNPFSQVSSKNSIHVDNPLDSSRRFLRTDLKESLINNLLYNERRQKDSIKLFEISDIYLSSSLQKRKKYIGIIASGRIARNYKDFSRKISDQYIKSIFTNNIKDLKLEFIDIPRASLDTKLSDHISYVEFEISDKLSFINDNDFEIKKIEFPRYRPISDLPSSVRDLSFSIKNPSSFKSLEDLILNFKHDLLKEVFIFDYYLNEKKKEIKAGFRFTLQSSSFTLTDSHVNEVIDNIINQALKIESVSIPGL